MACEHVREIAKGIKRSGSGCVECLELGMQWVHLRECLKCGHVGCCDSSVGKHATKHFGQTGHPIMRSIEPGESWRWCFVDEVEV
jgi:CPA1 family monovalent cation:H+ antiporter